MLNINENDEAPSYTHTNVPLHIVRIDAEIATQNVDISSLEFVSEESAPRKTNDNNAEHHNESDGKIDFFYESIDNIVDILHIKGEEEEEEYMQITMTLLWLSANAQF